MKRRGFLQALAAAGIALPLAKHLPRDEEIVGMPSRLHEADPQGNVSEIIGFHADHIVMDDFSDFHKTKFVLKIGRHKVAARGDMLQLKEMRRELIDITSTVSEVSHGYREFMPATPPIHTITFIANKVYIDKFQANQITNAEIFIARGSSLVLHSCELSRFNEFIPGTYIIELTAYGSVSTA